MDRNVGDGYFEITCVHRDDIRVALNIEDNEFISKITDDMMVEIADKMADDYCNQMFQDSLRIIANEILKREGIIQQAR